MSVYAEVLYIRLYYCQEESLNDRAHLTQELVSNIRPCLDLMVQTRLFFQMCVFKDTLPRVGY